MPDQTRLSSPDSYNNFFHHKSCQPWWNKTLSGKFPKKSIHWSQGWPWGYKDNPEPAEIVWEGYKNVIVDDKKLLEGAPPTKVRQLFQDWIKHHLQHNHCSISRSAFCLMIDNHALQSILASPEPSLETGNWITEKNGYVVLIDRYFPDRGFRHEPYNVDWVRLIIDGIWAFLYFFDTVKFECRYPAIGKPGLIPYFDGEWNWVDDVNRQKVTDIDSSGDEEEEEDYDDVVSDYGYHDIYQYLREGAYLNLNLFNVQYACSL
ncbi:hypothetical protein BDV23DRAFT_192040 [Aspergillus alliaceus]|uniref:Uncharacterized protein n=1 Tax=Petromyces alliaceus TaxID=209559 RepID=A0A5N7CG03_PETAA|nr:hypothetical protein BDV23DRAFT_192040 [Aspergillus alliaceus]